MFPFIAINNRCFRQVYSVTSSLFQSGVSASIRLVLPRFGEALFVVYSLFAPEREIRLRLCAMAAMRTKDRRRNRKNSAKTRRDSELQQNKDVAETETSKLTWSFCSSKGNSSYKDLGCTELHWPAEDERELSQEIVRVNPLNRRSILQVNKNFMNEYLEKIYR